MARRRRFPRRHRRRRSRLAARNGCASSRRAARESPYAATTLWAARAAPDRLDRAPGARLHGQRRAGRRRRGAWRALRDRHRTRRAPTARSATGWSTTSTRSTPRARRASSPRRCRSTTISATSTPARRWYRPSYMLVAVLADARAADARAVGARPRLQPVLPPPARLLPPDAQLHEHQRRHAARARAARPRARPTSRPLAVAGLSVPACAGAARSRRRSSRSTTACVDQTRLLPAAALEEIFTDLLALADRRATGTALGARSQTLSRADLDALVFLRFPQFPSSRAWGDAPAVTLAGVPLAAAARPGAAPDRPGAGPPVSRRASRRPDLLPPPTAPLGRRRRVWGGLADRRHSRRWCARVAALAASRRRSPGSRTGRRYEIHFHADGGARMCASLSAATTCAPAQDRAHRRRRPPSRASRRVARWPRAAARGHTQALSRGLAVLEALAATEGGATLTAIADRLALPAPTAYRLLATLAPKPATSSRARAASGWSACAPSASARVPRSSQSGRAGLSVPASG